LGGDTFMGTIVEELACHQLKERGARKEIKMGLGLQEAA
jgi:hypothetical protein